MSSDPKRAEKLNRLGAALEMVFQNDSATYQKDRAKIEVIERNIEQLRQKLDPKTAAGLDEVEMIYWSQHRTWITQTLRALNMDLARAYAEAEDRRLALVESNGRKHALAQIAKR